MIDETKVRWLQGIAYGLGVITVLGTGLIWFVDTRYVTHAEFNTDYVTQEEFDAAVEQLRSQQEALVNSKNYQLCVSQGYEVCACEQMLPVLERSCRR